MSTPELIVITPTADQPLGMRLAERYMARQTVQPTRWIVADDGATHATLTAGQEHLRRARTVDGGPSLAGNLLAALDALGPVSGAIVIWEHDDWYAARHLELCQTRLKTCGATGSIWQRYYNVPTRMFRIMRNIGSALCNTAFDASYRDLLRRAAEHAIAHNHYGIDRRLWEALPARARDLHQDNTVLGIKGLPGRAGLGVGHRPKREQWHADPEGAMLRTWIGADAEHYL